MRLDSKYTDVETDPFLPELSTLSHPGSELELSGTATNSVDSAAESSPFRLRRLSLLSAIIIFGLGLLALGSRASGGLPLHGEGSDLIELDQIQWAPSCECGISTPTFHTPPGARHPDPNGAAASLPPCFTEVSGWHGGAQPAFEWDTCFMGPQTFHLYQTGWRLTKIQNISYDYSKYGQDNYGGYGGGAGGGYGGGYGGYGGGNGKYDDPEMRKFYDQMYTNFSSNGSNSSDYWKNRNFSGGSNDSDYMKSFYDYHARQGFDKNSSDETGGADEKAEENPEAGEKAEHAEL